MKENFFISMFSEAGKISSKRWISITCSAVICFMAIWITLKYPQYITETFKSLLIFVAIMSGVATVGQIVTLVRGGPPAKDEGNSNTDVKP